MNETPARALSLRQPWAELVLRGIKTIEARSTRTKIRGPVQIYAGRNRIDKDSEARISKEYGIDVNALPRGVLVGIVTIVDCRPVTPADSPNACFSIDEDYEAFGWVLEDAKRFETLREPEAQPQPIFFYPFGKP